MLYIVDDDICVCESLAWLLQLYDYPIQQYSDPLQFLECFQYQKPCCVILDIRMPGLNGLEIQRRLKTKTKMTVPIIFISGHADDQVIKLTQDEGVLGLLIKPFEHQRLLNLLETVFYSKSQ